MLFACCIIKKMTTRNSDCIHGGNTENIVQAIIVGTIRYPMQC